MLACQLRSADGLPHRRFFMDALGYGSAVHNAALHFLAARCHAFFFSPPALNALGNAGRASQNTHSPFSAHLRFFTLFFVRT